MNNKFYNIEDLIKTEYLENNKNKDLHYDIMYDKEYMHLIIRPILLKTFAWLASRYDVNNASISTNKIETMHNIRRNLMDDEELINDFRMLINTVLDDIVYHYGHLKLKGDDN